MCFTSRCVHEDYYGECTKSKCVISLNDDEEIEQTFLQTLQEKIITKNDCRNDSNNSLNDDNQQIQEKTKLINIQ